MGRGPTVRINLTPEEQETLTMWTKGDTTEQCLAQRAKGILGSAQGLALPEISRHSGLSRQNCSRGHARSVRERSGGTSGPHAGWPLPGDPPGSAPSGHGLGLHQARR
jgi:hypothetical protein